MKYSINDLKLIQTKQIENAEPYTSLTRSPCGRMLMAVYESDSEGKFVMLEIKTLNKLVSSDRAHGVHFTSDLIAFKSDVTR